MEVEILVRGIFQLCSKNFDDLNEGGDDEGGDFGYIFKLELIRLLMYWM